MTGPSGFSRASHPSGSPYSTSYVCAYGRVERPGQRREGAVHGRDDLERVHVRGLAQRLPMRAASRPAARPAAPALPPSACSIWRALLPARVLFPRAASSSSSPFTPPPALYGARWPPPPPANAQRHFSPASPASPPSQAAAASAPTRKDDKKRAWGDEGGRLRRRRDETTRVPRKGGGTRRRETKREKRERRATLDIGARARDEEEAQKEVATGKTGDGMVGILWRDKAVTWLERDELAQALANGSMILSRIHLDRRIEVVAAPGSTARATVRVCLREDQASPVPVVMPGASTRQQLELKEAVPDIVDRIFDLAASWLIPYGGAGAWPLLSSLGQWAVFLGGGVAIDGDGEFVRALPIPAPAPTAPLPTRAASSSSTAQQPASLSSIPVSPAASSRPGAAPSPADPPRPTVTDPCPTPVPPRDDLFLFPTRMLLPPRPFECSYVARDPPALAPLQRGGKSAGGGAEDQTPSGAQGEGSGDADALLAAFAPESTPGESTGELGAAVFELKGAKIGLVERTLDQLNAPPPLPTLVSPPWRRDRVWQGAR
ncbi:hypothetical protein JCM10449v2_002744 [Rhodotorula kratochvilovae]